MTHRKGPRGGRYPSPGGDGRPILAPHRARLASRQMVGGSESAGVSPLRRSSIPCRWPAYRWDSRACTTGPVGVASTAREVRGRPIDGQPQRTRRRLATRCESTAAVRDDPAGATTRERAGPRCRTRRIHRAVPRTSPRSPMRGTSAATLARAAETRPGIEPATPIPRTIETRAQAERGSRAVPGRSAMLRSERRARSVDRTRGAHSPIRVDDHDPPARPRPTGTRSPA